ncbi:MAG: hypothetical protein ABR587_01800 [Candidatus Binatia bacterium]
MHCTFNHVVVRFNLYLVSTLAVWCIAPRSRTSEQDGSRAPTIPLSAGVLDPPHKSEGAKWVRPTPHTGETFLLGGEPVTEPLANRSDHGVPIMV